MGMLRNLWTRTKAWFARLFRRPEPAPGRFEPGSAFAARGWLAVRPWTPPSREYLVYVPRGHARWGFAKVPLIVLLHGCKQTPEDIATGTRIAALADELGCLVLLPRQREGANPYGCWNWFDGPTATGWGEAALVAAQIRKVLDGYRVDRRRVFVAGMSSGAALAAVMGLRHPDLVAGVFAHSGVACGAAASPLGALGVLKRGAERDVVGLALVAARAAQPDLPVPVCVVQGASDAVVAPVNAAQLVRQSLALNGHPALGQGAATDLPPPDEQAESSEGERRLTRSDWRLNGRLVARHILVDGLGHAWSGGDAALPYNDAAPPDATALLGAFVREVGS
jgi:poly(hydroxyalkanoate) depolymerase family esterase